MQNNRFIENKQENFDLRVKDLFFDKLNISHNRIHNIHKFVLKDEEKSEKIGSYRKKPVKISNIEKDKEEIFWYGVNPEDIKPFMDEFIKIYKTSSTSFLESNPFIKSALIHLLFVKIHPYYDGNGRTARILHNIKFTEMLNKIYGMNLKICPVNLSKSIKINLMSYMKALDNIYFDLDHDNNEMMNYWFNHILNMYDEQLFYNQNMINNMDELMGKIINMKEKMGINFEKEIGKKHIKLLKKY